MNFDKLNEMIPLVIGGKSKILEMHPYLGITLRMPGRHASATDPKGGDFVVCVDDEDMDWTEHQFTHADIFAQVENRFSVGAADMGNFMRFYLEIVQGANPELAPFTNTTGNMHPQTFFYAVQCLAVAEHRRYPQHEVKFGGRYLPFRAAAGIAEGLWTALEAQEKTRKRGRIGIEWLEKDYGLPTLTKELMGS